MSKYFVGTIGVAIAVVLIAFRSVISYSVAQKMNPEFAELAGASAVAMVIFGAIGLLFAHELWQSSKSWFSPKTVLAAACVVLTIAAEAYISRLDIRFQVAGQADVTASRVDQNARSADTRAELAKARGRRDVLTTKKTLSWIEREDLENLNERIKTLEAKWETTVVNAGGMPEASFMARWSHDEEWWEGALMIAQLIFWPLVGMFALPIAIVSMQGERKPSGLQQPNVTSTPLPAVSVRPRQPMVALERISGVNLAVTANNSADTLACEPNLAQTPALPTDPTDGGTPVAAPDHLRDITKLADEPVANVVKTDGTPYQHPKHSLKNLRGNVRVWKDERLERTALAGGGATTGALHDDYTRWCALRGHVALHKGPFGKALNKLGMKRVGKVAGSFRPGWVLKTEIAVKSRKAA